MLRTTWAGAPWGLVGMVVMIGLVETGLKRLDADLARPEMAVWRVTRDRARRQVVDAEILNFGTSLIQLGLHPPTLERETGRRAYSLASGGGRTTYAYYNLRRALNAGARPAAVVIDLHPSFLASKGYRSQANGWADALSTADCLDMAWSVRDGQFLGSTSLARALTSYRRRFEIRDAVRAALDGRPWSFRNHSDITIVVSHKNGGGLPPLKTVNYRGEIARDYEELWLAPRPHDPVEVAYLERFVDLAAGHGIVVYAVLMPVHPEIQRRRDELGLNAQLGPALACLARKSNVVLVDGRHAGYPVDAFHDATHLGRRGAEAFTLAMARLLASREAEPAGNAGSKRVALADYRESIDAGLARTPRPAEESRRMR